MSEVANPMGMFEGGASGKRGQRSRTIEAPTNYNEQLGSGRTCCEEGCITILCRYNPGPRCWGHAQAFDAMVKSAEQRRFERGHLHALPDIEPDEGQPWEVVPRTNGYVDISRAIHEMGQVAKI